METFKIVINVIFWAAFSFLFMAWFNAAIDDFKVLKQLNRWQRIMARLVIIVIWPVLFIISAGMLIILALHWLWKTFTK